MRIEDDIKLDFRDVLIRPKRSALSSRKDVDLSRTYKFKHSGFEWTGVPIMAANMDGVGTVEMANALSKHDLFTCLTKDITDFPADLNTARFAVSTGIGKNDLDRLLAVLKEHPYIQFICIDVANGYTEYFGDIVANVRREYPDKTIIAGNVVTADMTQELILRGADIIKLIIYPNKRGTLAQVLKFTSTNICASATKPTQNI